MSPSALLTALMALPLTGSLLTIIFVRIPRAPARLRSLAGLPTVIGAAIALIAAWLLRGQSDWEAVIGGWSPISFTGLPLAMADFAPAAGIIIAWVTVYFLNGLESLAASPDERDSVAGALCVASLTLVAFANNFVALLVGLGLTDLCTAYAALRQQGSGRAAMIQLMLNGVSITALIFVAVIHAAGGNSLHRPLVRLGDSTAPLMALAVALRLNVVPFRALPSAWSDPQNSAGAVSGLLVLTRLPGLGITGLPGWFYALALVGGLLTLIIAALQAEARKDALVPAAVTAGAYLAGASAILNMPGVTAAATIAWLIGTALIGRPGPVDAPPWVKSVRRAMRGVGALCLIGLPPMVGLVGHAGVITAWTARGTDGWPFALAWIVCLVLMVYALLTIVFSSTGEAVHDVRPAQERHHLSAQLAREAIGGLSAGVPVLLFGVAPALLTAGSLAEVLGRHGALGWAGWAVAVAAGALLWRLESRWRPAIGPIREWTTRALDLSWFYSLLDGAIGRLRYPFSRAFDLLESDGTLLWAIIAVLLIVLISRPGGP
ncbi:MAG: hypothetical protein NZM18_08300 [Thermoflexales bacterium]|nr:hypothetical protein [Thermoflexales bacterium]